MIDWNIVIRDIGPSIYRFFLTTFPAATADDLVQETLLRLVEKVEAGKFNASLGSLRMYAFGIAHFVRLEGLRLPKHEEMGEDHGSVDPLDEQVIQNQLRKKLRQAIANLTDIQQQVLALYLDSELSLEEIALILAIPAVTVRSHLHRAKENLKLELDQNGVKNERQR